MPTFQLSLISEDKPPCSRARSTRSINPVWKVASASSPAEGCDLVALKARIEDMGGKLRHNSAGDELDREIARLDHFKSIYVNLVPTTAS